MIIHKLKIAFLWHQHKPYYKDSQLRKFITTWTRLHGIGVKMLFRDHGLSDFLVRQNHFEQLPKIAAGSWIYGNFDIWLGCSELF